MISELKLSPNGVSVEDWNQTNVISDEIPNEIKWLIFAINLSQQTNRQNIKTLNKNNIYKKIS